MGLWLSIRTRYNGFCIGILFLILFDEIFSKSTGLSIEEVKAIIKEQN